VALLKYARQSAKAWYRFSDYTSARPLPALRSALREPFPREITSAPFGNVRISCVFQRGPASLGQFRSASGKRVY